MGGARFARAPHLTVFDHFGIVFHHFGIVFVHFAIVFAHFGIVLGSPWGSVLHWGSVCFAILA